MSAFNIFTIQLQDAATGRTLSDVSGYAQIMINGTMHKATLYDPANNMAALANPIAISQGRIIFAVSTGGPGQATPMAVDFTGITSTGQCFYGRGAKPGAPTEVYVNPLRAHQRLIVPFSVADSTPGTEKNTGLLLPAGALVLPNPVTIVTVAAGQGSKVVDLGLLSTESGGDADGFVDGISLTSIANIKSTLNGATPTLGGLLNVASVAGTERVPEGALIAAAVTLSYTITSATTLAEGYVSLPILLT